MKKILPFILLFILAIPQGASAQERLYTEEPTYLTDFEQDYAERIYEIGKWATISSGAVVASGALIWYLGELSIREQLKDSDVVNGIVSTVGLMQILMGGICLTAAVPLYLWGLDLNNNPDGISLEMGEKQRGWGGRLDVGWGFSNTPNIGGSIGYNFNHRLFIGIGAGYEYDLNGEGPYNYPVIPAYADIRYRLGGSRITPYLGVKAGFDFNGVPIPYGTIDWGVSQRCRNSSGAWWYALSLSNNYNNTLSFRISRSF